MPQTKEHQEFMTVSQAAKLFAVDIKTIRNWITDGKFPGAFKVQGGSKMPWIIPTESVEAYKKERDQVAP